MLDRPDEYRRMREAEDTLWWYRALHDLVLRALNGLPEPREQAVVIDAGCGTGGLLQQLRAQGYQCLTGFDLSPEAVEYTRRRGFEVKCLSLQEMAGHYPAGCADALISCDSLCCLSPEEQRVFVHAVALVLKPGGLFIGNVPALRAFEGTHDRIVGIRERFARPGVLSLFDDRLWRVSRLLYWPFLLSPLIFLARWRQRRESRRHPEKNFQSDVALPPAALNRLLAWITLAENRVLPWKPWGSSLFVTAQRVGLMADMRSTTKQRP